jgi:hypothetical protein
VSLSKLIQLRKDHQSRESKNGARKTIGKPPSEKLKAHRDQLVKLNQVLREHSGEQTVAGNRLERWKEAPQGNAVNAAKVRATADVKVGEFSSGQHSSYRGRMFVGT